MNLTHHELSRHAGHVLACNSYAAGKFVTIECKDCGTLMYQIEQATYACPHCHEVSLAAAWDEATKNFFNQEIVLLDVSTLDNLHSHYIYCCPSCNSQVKSCDLLTKIEGALH